MSLTVSPSPARSSNQWPRQARLRRYVMCPPRHFDVTYSINPWMHPAVGVDAALAMRQWQVVRDTYVGLGHRVHDVAPPPGLPDIVFTANGGLVIAGRVLLSRFRHSERAGEESVFRDWFRGQGLETVEARRCNEGEGDYLVTGRGVLAGSGFRTDPRAHAEVARFSGQAVVPLELVDPRFYHLDTALAVLDDRTIAYYPAAFTRASQRVLADMYPDAVVASEGDAVAFGLNACSDGRHVLLSAEATGLAAQLAARGFDPIPIDTSELQKAGGSVKCCTLEMRP